MTFLTCGWCGYIYPLQKKAECPYCGTKRNEYPRINVQKEPGKEKKTSLPRCA